MSLRSDLLALSLDDLAALTNRGTVKRAQREIEAKECTGEIVESPEGDVTAKWSDGVECRIAAGAVLADGRCSCAAAGLCRHLIRSVLAYQQQAAQQTADQPAAPAEPWDPGSITDEELAKHYRPAAFTKIREEFQKGILVELVRSTKPSARFHLQASLIRFLVQGDVRYTHCDCAEPAPCRHVPLAVWAFRRLEPQRNAGILATGEKTPAAPLDLLNELETAVLDFCEHGVSGVASAWTSRLARLEVACRQADLIWPATILAELGEQQKRYAEHDALFAPERIAELIGELLIRLDAIRRDTGALPQLLIRGTSADRPVSLGSARFIGLGCGARLLKRGVELTAYLQDSDSGSMVAVRKEFADNPDPAKTPRAFGELAQASAAKGSSFAMLGTGQLLIRGGKRTASFQLIPGRSDASVQPQAFAWESLRPPVLIEELAELEARLSALPPASLRPRRVAEDFHVCAVTGAEGVHFDAATQTVRATLLDRHGQRLLLAHPYSSRGAAGSEALLARLLMQPGDLRFVSGPVQRGVLGLMIQPVCLIWQDSGKRTALQPWIEQRSGSSAADHLLSAPAHLTEPLRDYLIHLQNSLGELFVLGLQRSDPLVARRWQELWRQSEAVGLTRLAKRIAPLAESLEQKRHTLRWDTRAAGQHLLQTAVLARMAQDLTAG
ncbi:MAG TPA: hypothetical protein VMG10_33190 [Gemmataceae bacterium]|nr:hypothetical protein [Gemmataceae bacterium]